MNYVTSFKRNRAISRTGCIFSTIGTASTIIALIAVFSSIISVFVYVFYYIFLVFSIFCTLGIVLLNENFRKLLNSGGGNLTYVFDLVSKYIPYFVFIGFGASLIGLILCMFDKKWKYSKRGKINSIICLTLSTICMILYFVVKKG